VSKKKELCPAVYYCLAETVNYVTEYSACSTTFFSTTSFWVDKYFMKHGLCVNTLVLKCLRHSALEEKLKHLNDITAREWDSITVTAERLHAGALLYYSLKPIISKLTIPNELRQKMRDKYLISAARNIRLYEQLVEVISALNKEDIEVVLLKGAHLATSVYTNPGLRSMADIDILAKRKDLVLIDRVLRELGYVTSAASVGCTLEHLEHLELYNKKAGSPLKHLTPYTKKNAMRVEVHFHIAKPPFSQLVDLAELWNRARRQAIDSVEVLTLSPEDLLLHLCLHACIDHGFGLGLRPFLDIQHVLEHYRKEIDWEVVLQRAGEWGLKQCIFLMLALSENMLGLILPDAMRHEILSYDEVREAVPSAEELIFFTGLYVPTNIARFFEMGWRSKISYFRTRAFPSKEILTLGITDNRKITQLSRLRLLWSRWQQLRQNHLQTIWSILRKDPQTTTALELQIKRNQMSDWLKKMARPQYNLQSGTFKG
jgi:hypothetical protein